MNGIDRRFVDLPASVAYEGILYTMRTRIGRLGVKEEVTEPPRIKVVLNLLVGVDIRILREDGACTVVLNFSLRRCYILTSILFSVALAIAIVTRNGGPFMGFVFAIVIILGAQYTMKNFREVVYRDLSRLEREYSKRAIYEEKARWQDITIDIDKLRKELSEIHLKKWRDTYVLEYKINEYTRQGFTYREALLKIADEEGFLKGKLAEEET